MTSPDDIKQWLEAGFDDANIRVVGDGRHFEAHIVAAAFSGLNTLQRHRLVYSILGDKMKADIHALSIKTLTVNEQ